MFSKKIEAAYLLAQQTHLQNYIYDIINVYGYPDYVTLSDIIDDIHRKKEEYESIIDGD